MAEDHGPSEEAVQKRKRIDARIYKQQWMISNTKKQKGGGDSTPEIKDGKLSSENSRIDDEVKSQPGNVNEGTPLEQSATSASKGSEQASSSTDAPLPAITHGERIEDGGIGVKDKLENPGDCTTKLPRHIEYWVPVALSYVQLEKYCETLVKSSMLLSSNLKNEVLDSLHEILNSIRKCCDHPYLVDSTLQEFIYGRRLSGDYLSNGIEVSGKLFLLGKLLEEVKRKNLRVLIVFQSNDSKSQSINLQHFLDDLVLGKVGEGCYVHIFREFDSSQKRASVDLFNDKESGKLVMLIEKSSCQSNIKLSSMDFVILFNSDLNPINDMKSLRRMTIQSKFDHLKVFRLYSSYSVEEKALSLAKEGNALESTLQNIGHTSCHTLLLWGASHLFSKLDKFHSKSSSISDLKCLSEDKLALDVVNEISKVLSCEDNDITSFIFVRKVVGSENNDYSHNNILLQGEKDEPSRDEDLPPFVIWCSLLEGKNPLWKLLPGSLEKPRRKGRLSSKLTSYAEYDDSSEEMRARKVCRPVEERIAGPLKSRGNSVKKLSSGYDFGGPGKIEETCVRRMRELILKQKEEIREFYNTKRKARENLDKEHQSEFNLINERYKEAKINKDKLKNLDFIYEQKLEEHNRVMDEKREDLEAKQLASRMNEKDLKEKLFALLKTKDYTLIKLSLLETPLGQKVVGLTEKSSDSGILKSNPSLLESEGSPEINHGTINASLQQDNLDSRPDQSLAAADILSIESKEGNFGTSILREEVCDTADCENDVNCEDETRGTTNSDTSANLVCNTKAQTEPSNNDEVDMRSGTDSGTRQMIEELRVGEDNVEVRCVGDSGTTRVGEQRVEETNCGAHIGTGSCNEEARNMACGVQADIRESSNGEVPSSRFDGEREVLTRPQLCYVNGNSSRLEQPPVSSSNIPCNDIRPTTGTSGLLNSHTSRVLTPCQPGYIQPPFTNIGLNDQPVIQSQLQSSTGQPHPHLSNNMVNTQESSFSNDQIPPRCLDPLQFELDKIKKALEELFKVHTEKVQHLESNRAKEIQEIENKYSLLIRESKDEFVRRELEINSVYRKVEANKLLAEALKSSKEKQMSSPISQEELWNAILKMYPQLNVPTQRTSMATSTTLPQSLPPLQPQPPVQVQNLSELITLNSTLTNHPPNSLSNQTRLSPPQLCSLVRPVLRPVFPPPSDILSSFNGVMNQPNGVFMSMPGLYQTGFSSRSALQHGGSPQNPLLL